ncbi:hypothetical protein F0L68_19620 [Solihabitans fulvus]|uniref:Uncharacterized protein n=1 Tax=Solihabitans fulvus TaxID=1892852 RepID=A0A5B2XD97_9PSEU|nr:hypothetical protein [Solihabitans fulvus]KAA2260999.1 hypothetical protein F0L68_19620 [Solihabitans fulvus]
MGQATLRLDAGDVDDVRRHRLTRSLFDDLRALHLVNIARPELEAPQGARSGTGQGVAELIITGVLSTGTVTAIAKVITAYLDRTKSRSVTWLQDGREVTFTGISQQDQAALAEALAGASDPEGG